MEALELYGQDAQMISQYIGTKTCRQVKDYLRQTRQILEANPGFGGEELQEFVSHLKTLVGVWTQEEKSKFLEVILVFGKNWNKISQHIGSQDALAARVHGGSLLKILKNQPTLTDLEKKY